MMNLSNIKKFIAGVSITGTCKGSNYRNLVFNNVPHDDYYIDIIVQQKKKIHIMYWIR
jgi:hypothetical protein